MAKERRSDFPESDIEISDTLSSVDIFNKGMDGDELAVEVFRRMGFCLGVAIAGFINMLNPEVVVIGGGAAAGWPLFAGEMLDTIKLRAFSRPANRARIVRASLGDDAGLLGAASLVFSRRRPSS